MARATDETRVFQGSYDSVFNAVCRAAQANGWTVQWADPSTGVAYVSASMSALSWGEDADIRVVPAHSGGVSVAVRFKLKFGLYDWGKTRKNVDRLFAAVDQILATGGAGGAPGWTPTGRPAPGWYPDPSGRHQTRYWDGMVWTEHVADNGVAGVDPA